MSTGLCEISMDQDGAWGSGVAGVSLVEKKRGFKNIIGMAKLPDCMDHILQSSSGDSQVLCPSEGWEDICRGRQCPPASHCSAVGWVSARHAERRHDPPAWLPPTGTIQWPKIFHGSKLWSCTFADVNLHFGQPGPCWRIGRKGRCSPGKGEAAERIGTGLHTRTALFLPAAKHFTLQSNPGFVSFPLLLYI